MAAMIHLLNGSTQIRVKSSEGCTVLKCGCAHTDVMWLQMCDEHYQEVQAIHQLALERRSGHKVEAATAAAVPDRGEDPQLGSGDRAGSGREG